MNWRRCNEDKYNEVNWRIHAAKWINWWRRAVQWMNLKRHAAKWMYRKMQRSDCIEEDVVPCNEEDADGKVLAKHRDYEEVAEILVCIGFY